MVLLAWPLVVLLYSLVILASSLVVLVVVSVGLFINNRLIKCLKKITAQKFKIILTNIFRLNSMQIFDAFSTILWLCFNKKDVFFEMQEKCITKSSNFLSENGVKFILKWKKTVRIIHDCSFDKTHRSRILYAPIVK